MAQFLMVHGAFQGEWIWREVASLLTQKGHEVYTPTLSGCGHLFHAHNGSIDLTTYIQDILEYIRMENLEGVTLVGHSYSGLICGAVMHKEPHKIAKAVLVDCLLPEKGKSFAQIAGDKFAGLLENHRSGESMVRPWPRPTFGIPEEKDAWFFSRLTEFPYAAFTTPFPEEFTGKECPVTFIHCTETASPFIQRMAQTANAFGWEQRELNTGHFPMVTMPQELAALIHEAV